MKILYAARMARFDLLRAVCHLACFITKWTPECDKRLHRFVCYIHSTKSHRMVGWVGDALKDADLHLYADADFAGCTDTQRSTSGCHLQMRGKHTCFPLAGISKRQSCVSHSTPEAELVAASFALRTVGLPAVLLWDRVRAPAAPVCPGTPTTELPHTPRPVPGGGRPLRCTRTTKP